MKPPLLACFIDGLRPDSLQHMPFVSTFGGAARIRTELGYSITCHPSMYTGVYPDQHLSWFIWQKNEETSPFKWINRTKLDRLPESPYVKYGLYRATRAVHGNSAFFSVPFPAYVPLKHWHCFDVTEKHFWDEDHFNPHFPTIFELFRAGGSTTKIVGMNQNAAHAAEQLLSISPSYAEFTYLFFGDIDAVSHFKGHDSPEARERLRLVDRAIERWFKNYPREHGEPTFVLWSDHGHIPIEQKVDINRIFAERGVHLDSIVHFVDANYARFWFRNDAERARVERVLPDLGQGFVITPEIAEKYHVRMPDNRYGDLVFYLEAPAVFDKGTVNVLGRRLGAKDVSMHGYSPENDGVDGTLVASRPIRSSRRPILQDIPPTLLRHFGLPIPGHMVGEPLW